MASLSVFLVCVISLSFFGFGELRYLTSDYRTGVGEQTSVLLSDGSEVILDADSALSVDYSANKRYLTLYQGRGYFRVAADKQRPFIVNSRRGEVLALGTEFEVDSIHQEVAVTVFESAVEVSQGRHVTMLSAGQQLYYSSGIGVSVPRPVKLQQAGVWRNGQLVFCNKPLVEVVEEINRYRPGWIVIADESLHAIRVSGVFDLRQPDAALQTLVEVFPMRQRTLTNYLILLERS